MRKTIALLLAATMVIAMAACAQKEQPPPAKVDGPRMVQVGGELYTDTGEIITLARCGVMDGEITKTVAETELPGEDDCSNFGTGYQYQIAGVYSIDVVIDGD